VNGYVRILGVELPTRYAVGIGATVVALLVLLVGGRGGDDQDQAATTSSTTSVPTTTTTTPREGRSPITIRQRTAADLVIRADWVKKGTSQYADPSDDRASTQTITTLAPSTSASVPRYRPATTTTDAPSGDGDGSGTSNGSGG